MDTLIGIPRCFTFISLSLATLQLQSLMHLWAHSRRNKVESKVYKLDNIAYVHICSHGSTQGQSKVDELQAQQQPAYRKSERKGRPVCQKTVQKTRKHCKAHALKVLRDEVPYP